MKTLFYDLELTPLTTHTWSLWPNSIPIQQIVKPQEMLCFGARWHGEKRLTFSSGELDPRKGVPRREMLEIAWKLFDEADATVGWNSASFDAKHLRREWLEAGMPPPSPWREIDLMRVAKSQFKMPSNKLDYWAQDLGIGKKTQHTGFQLWLDCMDSDPKAWNLMEKYQRQDVNLLVDLYDRLLPWITNHPNVALYDGVEMGCKNCASVNLMRRGYRMTNTGKYPRYRCNDCGTWGYSKTRVATTEMR